MRLAEYQRALLALSFAEAPPAELGSLGLYRKLVRARLFSMAQSAYRRSWAGLGASACDASFARFLAVEPPRSPLIREVIGAFGAFAEQDRALLAGAPPWAVSLLRFECAKWRVACALAGAHAPAPVRELDFEGALALNPTLELVSLEHACAEPRELANDADPHTLLVYRRPDEDDVRWYRAPALLAELLAAARVSADSLATLLPRVLARRGQIADEALLEELAAALAAAVERSVVLGVYDTNR